MPGRLPAHLLRTKVAQSATEFALTFNLAFGKTLLAPGYLPEMVAPEGQSTRGGSQAAQKLRLVPRQEGLSNLVFGTADATEKTAELRTFEAMDENYRAHFGGTPLQLDRSGYASFLLKAQSFFESQGFAITLLEPSAQLPARTRPRGGMIAGFVLGAVAVLAAVAAWFITRHG